jgi:hypothetical protein
MILEYITNERREEAVAVCLSVCLKMVSRNMPGGAARD